LVAEGVVFRCGVRAGVDVTGDELRAGWDAVVLAGGAERPRDLEVPGRQLDGVHFAMDFLTQQNRRVSGLAVEARPILAPGKRVVVPGGGDTGSDCVGTSHRQGAASVLSLELMPRPPDDRRADNPWPAWPLIYRTSSSHDEGGVREFGIRTTRLIGEGAPPSASPPAGRSPSGPPARRVVALETVRADAKATLEIPCDLVLLAMGFLGPVTDDVVAQLGCALDRRGNVATQNGATSVPGVFAAGDMARGQSLVVWAIAEGRRVAARVDR